MTQSQTQTNAYTRERHRHKTQDTRHKTQDTRHKNERERETEKGTGTETEIDRQHRTPTEESECGTVLVSKEGVAAARQRLEPGKCVVRHTHKACVQEWCSCAEGMRARVSSTLF